MTDLHTLANAISDSSPAIKRFAVAVADKLEAVAPPAQGKAWGIAPSYGSSGFNPAVDTQMVTYVALGTTCPRLPGNDAASLSARSHGFKRWVAWLTGDGSATPDQIVAYARKYPEAWVGFGNELNLNSAWKVADVAAKQVQVYQAVKAAGLPNKVGLSATATPASSAEHLSVLDLRWQGVLSAKASTSRTSICTRAILPRRISGRICGRRTRRASRACPCSAVPRSLCRKWERRSGRT